MGYTSGAAMEERGLRDIERWRDKIEVRLDNRQVFFLFFGSALVACMLFVLGVIVGKRLESRGRAVSPEIEDPLALLDKVSTTPKAAQAGVTFPQALFGNAAKTADKHGKKVLLPGPAAALDKPETAKSVALVESPKAAVIPSPGPAEEEEADEGEVKSSSGKPDTKVAAKAAEAKPSMAKAEPKTETKPSLAKVEAKPETKAAGKPAEAAAAVTMADAAAKPKSPEPKQPKPTGGIPTVAAGDIKGRGRFALQLSSFQDKAEAEAFARKFEGERPYMVVSEIPGKGTWYRVRVGDFASAKDATLAKQTFEKKHNVIAYVAQK